MTKKSNQSNGTALALVSSTVDVSKILGAIAYNQDSDKRVATSASARYNWLCKHFTARELTDQQVAEIREQFDGMLPPNVVYDEGKGKFVAMGDTTLLLHRKALAGKKINRELVKRILTDEGGDRDFKLFMNFLSKTQVEKDKREFTAKEAQAILLRAVTAKPEEVEAFDEAQSA